MSIFGKKETYSAPVVEGYDCENLGSTYINMEAFEDQLAIVKSIHKLDTIEFAAKDKVNSMIESGYSQFEVENAMDKFEAAYEAWYGDVFEKVKKFFSNLWAKISAFFKSIIRFFEGFIRSGKNFAIKYKEDIQKRDNAGELKGYKVKCFNYTNLEGSEAAKIFNDVYDYGRGKKLNPGVKMEDSSKDLQRDKEENVKGLRGKLMGGGSLTSDMYKDKLFSHFRGGAKPGTDKPERELSPKDVFDFLIEGEQAKTAAEAKTSADKMFTTMLSDIDKLMSALGNEEKEGKFNIGSVHQGEDEPSSTGNMLDAGMTHAANNKSIRQNAIAMLRESSSFWGEAKTIALEYFEAWKTAVSDNTADYRKWVTGAMGYKKAK